MAAEACHERPWHAIPSLRRIPWHDMIPWHAMAYHGVPWHAMGCHGMPLDAMASHAMEYAAEYHAYCKLLRGAWVFDRGYSKLLGK